MDFCSWVRVVFFDGEVNGGPVLVKCQATDSSVLTMSFVEPVKNLGGGHVVGCISQEILRIFLAVAKKTQNKTKKQASKQTNKKPNCTVQSENTC